MKKFKHLGIVTIAAILMTLLSSSEGCPAVDPLGHTVFLPHEDYCEAFYQCSNGVKIFRRCPDNLWFDPRRDVCDWPQNVCCPSLSGCFDGNTNYNGERGWDNKQRTCRINDEIIVNHQCFPVGIFTSCESYCYGPGYRSCTESEILQCSCQDLS